MQLLACEDNYNPGARFHIVVIITYAGFAQQMPAKVNNSHKDRLERIA